MRPRSRARLRVALLPRRVRSIGIRGRAWQHHCAHWLWKIPKTTACCCFRSCGAAATPALAPPESLPPHSCSLARSWRCLTIRAANGARARWRAATVARHKSRPSFVVRQIGSEKKGNCCLETRAGRRGTTSSHISNPNRTKRESKDPAPSQFSNCKHRFHNRHDCFYFAFAAAGLSLHASRPVLPPHKNSSDTKCPATLRNFHCSTTARTPRLLPPHIVFQISSQVLPHLLQRRTIAL